MRRGEQLDEAKEDKEGPKMEYWGDNSEDYLEEAPQEKEEYVGDNGEDVPEEEQEAKQDPGENSDDHVLGDQGKKQKENWVEDWMDDDNQGDYYYMGYEPVTP